MRANSHSSDPQQYYWNQYFPLGEPRTLIHREGTGQNRDDVSPLGVKVLEAQEEMKIVTFGSESTAN